jgi:hypothetical protein
LRGDLEADEEGVTGKGTANSRGPVDRFGGDLEGDLLGEEGRTGMETVDNEALGEAEARMRVREEALDVVLSVGRSARGMCGMGDKLV